jgi:hypothetical protein
MKRQGSESSKRQRRIETEKPNNEAQAFPVTKDQVEAAGSQPQPKEYAPKAIFPFFSSGQKNLQFSMEITLEIFKCSEYY